MTRAFETILWQQDGGVGTITINRPEQFNGMTNTMLRETHELLHDVADDDTVTVIVLTNNYDQRDRVFLIVQQAMAEAMGKPFPTGLKS